MLHEEFAQRVAERLEARADALEHEGHLAGRDTTARATELRTAAEIARDEAATVIQEKPRRPKRRHKTSRV